MRNEQFINDILLYISEEHAGGKIGGVKLASLIRHITELEIEEGGPYSFKPENGAASADIGLNLAIACFLAMIDVRLPKLDAHIKEHLIIASEPFGSVLNDKIIQELIPRYGKLAGHAENEDSSSPRIKIVYDRDEQRIMDRIREKFHRRFASFPARLRERAKESVEKTIRGNKDKQMSLMAHYTKIALGKAGDVITDDMVADAGMANIFFWTAFIIYDDFWDLDDAADPRLLPIANIFARYYIDFYTTLPDKKEFRPFFHELMDKLDSANSWELENCRAEVKKNIFHIPQALPDFKDYENKYRPASGHILASLAIFNRLNTALNPDDLKNIILYFRHYLIAMQLNDDARDWEEDIRRGHISTVVAILLADLKKRGWEKPIIDLTADIDEIRKIFWFDTMPQYINIALSQTKAPREALRSVSIIENPEPLERIINTSEKVAYLAKKESEDADALLREYGI